MLAVLSAKKKGDRPGIALLYGHWVAAVSVYFVCIILSILEVYDIYIYYVVSGCTRD